DSLVHSYIRTAEALAESVAAFRRQPLVGADTEAASFHRYRDRIFLVQLSSRDGRTAIIDPLALPDLAPLGELLADPAVEKVFHDADYDLRILDRDYRFRAARIFDTRIAAQLAGEPAVGLAALLEKYVGVKLAKEHQKADWSRRPLPPAMLEYAAADTQHLPALRDALRDRLPQLPATLARRHGPALLESVRRALALAEAELPRIERSARPPKDAAFDGRVERLKAARNRVAAEFGLDPGVLCGRSTLEAVARTTPTPNDRAGLSRVAELRRWQIEVLGNALLAALA